MKAYKVKKTGTYIDTYGYDTYFTKNEYYFDKNKALEEYKKGEYKDTFTRITTTYENGEKFITETGEGAYEERKEKAKPNQMVELITITKNHYHLEEIEIF